MEWSFSGTVLNHSGKFRNTYVYLSQFPCKRLQLHRASETVLQRCVHVKRVPEHIFLALMMRIRSPNRYQQGQEFPLAKTSWYVFPSSMLYACRKLTVTEGLKHVFFLHPNSMNYVHPRWSERDLHLSRSPNNNIHRYFSLRKVIWFDIVH